MLGKMRKIVKNWIKIAGVCGIVLIILNLISIVFNYVFLNYYDFGMSLVYILSMFISFIIFTIFYTLFYYGFVVVGKKYNKKLLLFAGWLVIIYGLLSFIVMIIRFSVGVNDWFLPSPFSSILSTLQVLSQVLFGIGLITLSKKIKYALAAGILSLLSLLIERFYFLFLMRYFSTDYLIPVYTALSEAVYTIILIFGILILFKASKERKSKRK